MSQKYSDQVECLIGLGYFLCPALMVATAAVTGGPPADREADWEAGTIAARLINFLFFADLIYCVGLVVLLRGRRWAAGICGILTLPVLLIAYAGACWRLTGWFL
jgi:hypothetical protein